MSKLLNWVDERFPLSKMYTEHLVNYPAPKNLNFWYFFGSLGLLVLVNQIVTGIWLTMLYDPTAQGAFASIEYIMRDVPYGWLLRYMHSTGASAFFIVIYLHMYRAIIYGSYKKPLELVWIFGMLIFSILMAEGFMGYLLPWGQMSFWGAQVVTSLFGAIPVIGEGLTTWIRGDVGISGVTLTRFFALHVVALPLLLLMLVVMHIVALHEVGSNNPQGIDIKKHKDDKGWPLDAVSFHPYFTVKDLVGVSVFLIIFCYVIFFNPSMSGHFLEAPNFEPANPMKTPIHIAPVWYFTPFYAILRAIPDKLMGVVAMGGAVMIFFALPWLDRCPVKSIRYRSRLHYANITQFVICFIILGILGTLPASELSTIIARVCSLGYFMFFVLLFFYSKNEVTKPVPERVDY